MIEAIIDLEQVEPVSPYPLDIEDFFQKSRFVILTIPKEISNMQEATAPDILVTSAKQYVDYLDKEIAFWKSRDPDNKLEIFSKCSSLENARHSFETFMKQWHANHANALSVIRQSPCFQKGALSSNTHLAAYLLQLDDPSQQFLTGFKYALYNDKAVELPRHIDTQEGFYAGLAYRNVIQSHMSMIDHHGTNLLNAAEKASNDYAELTAQYQRAFTDQESRMATVVQQTNDHFAKIETQKNDFFETANNALGSLENLYGEKLKLSEPAEYWEKIDKEYNAKGTRWLIASAILSVIIIAGLITFLVFVPTIFSEDYHWFDNLKNSAIVTVIASIAIYMLRLTVKMAMSSFHLARDAKERNNLSYFYLALIEKDAVSDKERALVLNSLFSRSDTGLLKGESSPSMPSNIADLVDVLSKKQ